MQTEPLDLQLYKQLGSSFYWYFVYDVPEIERSRKKKKTFLANMMPTGLYLSSFKKLMIALTVWLTNIQIDGENVT